jgi:hypothetical protein
VKPVRWSSHAIQNLVDREIDRREADGTLDAAEFTLPDRSGRRILMRRYLDGLLQRKMLLRVVVEETTTEIVVVTLYKTSQIDKYIRGLAP